MPVGVDDLAGHRIVGFRSSRTRELMPLEFLVDGHVRKVLLPGRVTVGGSDMMAAMARNGLGLVQQPLYRLRRDLETGALSEVLARHPPPGTPLSILYTQNRRLSPRVRAFIDWAVAIFQCADL